MYICCYLDILGEGDSDESSGDDDDDDDNNDDDEEGENKGSWIVQAMVSSTYKVFWIQNDYYYVYLKKRMKLKFLGSKTVLFIRQVLFALADEQKMEIIDHTETNLVALRRTIYLTIQSRYSEDHSSPTEFLEQSRELWPCVAPIQLTWFP